VVCGYSPTTMADTTKTALEPEEVEAFQVQIASCDANIGRLDREIKALQAKRSAEMAMRDGLRAKLGPNIPVATNSAEKPATESAPPKGFREAIRDVLRDSGRGMLPREVAEELRRRKFPYAGTVDLATRVSNDLFRMRESGKVRKHGRNYYSIEKATPSADAMN
jgi:hypothetical protein